MRRMLALAVNDLRLTLKDRPAIFWMVIMPAFFIYVFGHMSGGGDEAPRVRLGVLDEDGTFLSQSFREALEREGFDLEAVTVAQVDSLRAGPRHVRIPAGFQDSLAGGGQVPVYLAASAGADVEYTLTARLHVQRAIIALLGDLIRTVPGGDDAGGGAGAQPAALVIDSTFQRALAAAAAEAPRVGVRSESAGRGRPVPSGMNHSLPASLTLFMLINTAIYGAIFLAEEKETRVLARIATFPLPRAQILAGKLLGRVLLALGQSAIMLLIGRFVLGVYLGNSLPALVLVVVCLSLAVAAIALFWGAVLRSVEQATAVVMVASLFLGAIGGCWWPLEVVPEWMRAAGHISPAAWGMDGFHAVISYGAGVGAVLVPCLVLLGYAALFTALGARLLRSAS